jgi:flagellar biosynthesis GTPase FlhF
MKFEVSDGLDSQTKYPQIELCIRKINDENINIELIDTAGCSDSGGSDEENFKYLIDELKKKKSIDLFLLVFNFTNRIDGKTKDYMKLIANTFTPTEFFNHLAIIFTFYPENPSDTQIKKKEKITRQIIGIIKDTIGLADGQTTFCPAIYELDTEKKNGDFIEKFQATIDIILLKMQMIIKVNGEVNTENIKFCGVKDRLKEEQEKLEKQRLENERIQKENEEKSRKLEEDKRKAEEKRRIYEERIRERRRRELEERRREEERQRRLREEIRRREEEIKREEETRRQRIKEMEEEARRLRLENERREREYEERMRRYEYERRRNSGFCIIV